MPAVHCRVLNVLTALSLCILAAAGWARSYFRRDVVTIQSGRRSVNIFSDVGACLVVTRLNPVDYGDA